MIITVKQTRPIKFSRIRKKLMAGISVLLYLLFGLAFWARGNISFQVFSEGWVAVCCLAIVMVFIAWRKESGYLEFSNIGVSITNAQLFSPNKNIHIVPIGSIMKITCDESWFDAVVTVQSVSEQKTCYVIKREAKLIKEIVK